MNPPRPATPRLVYAKRLFCFSKTLVSSRRNDVLQNRARCCCNFFGHFQHLPVYTVNGECLPPIYTAKPLLSGPPFFDGRRRGLDMVPSKPSPLPAKNNTSKSGGFVHARRYFLKPFVSCTRNPYFLHAQILSVGAWVAACRVQNPRPCRRDFASLKLGVSPARGEGEALRDWFFTWFAARAPRRLLGQGNL